MGLCTLFLALFHSFLKACSKVTLKKQRYKTEVHHQQKLLLDTSDAILCSSIIVVFRSANFQESSRRRGSGFFPCSLSLSHHFTSSWTSFLHCCKVCVNITLFGVSTNIRNPTCLPHGLGNHMIISIVIITTGK